MRNMTWLAAIALSVACVHSRQDDYEAQQRAVYEQQKADQANAAAAAAAQQAEQQRQYAAEQSRRAAEAQAEAGSQGWQPAPQTYQPGPRVYVAPSNAPVARTAQVIEGQILNASDDTVTLRTLHSGTVNLAISDQTRITIDGEPVGRASNLTPGEDVRASFQVIDGQPQALQIRAHAGMSPIPQTH